MNKKSVVYFLVLIVAVSVFLSIFYGKVIMSPNSYLFNVKGDGIKNYYTYAYFIENNQSNTNFEGMNYPYGENFMYTDCHPLLASVLNFLNQLFPGLSNYSIGILNLLLVLSIGITVFILYFIFRELKINYILAILGALGISALSPQILRITGHLALSYSFFIPLTIYLILLYERSDKRKSIFLLLSASILFYFFTHAYLGMIASTQVFIYSITGIIYQSISDKRLRISGHFLLVLASVIPVVLFYIFVKITDIHTGRTTNPWGILEAFADLSTIFLPVMGPLNKIKDNLLPGIKQTFEGWSYIGFSTIMGILFIVWISVKSSVNKKKIGLDKTWLNPIPLRLLFISSIFILAFSMFIPFRWNMQWLINYFDIIKQFRALGRFAWVFYFVSTITLIFIVNKAFQKLLENKRRWIAYGLIILVPLSLLYEGQAYHSYFANEMKQSANLFDIHQTSATFSEDIKIINPDKYQAILPFPFFYIGSENYGKQANDKIYRLSFLFSYHLRLPILGSYLSRTSIDESKKIMQLLASNFYHKRIQDDLPNDKPFLLLCLNEELFVTEADYLKKAKLLISREEYSLYEINTGVFFENTAVEEFEQFNNVKEKLFEKDGFLVSDTSLFFSFLDFEQADTDLSFSGENGCYSGFQRNYNTLLSTEPHSLQLNKKYTTRFWMYNEGKNFGQDCIAGMIFFQKRNGDNLEWLNPIINAGTSHEIYDQWTLVELSFTCTDTQAIYDLVIKGDDISKKKIFVDDLLFYDHDLSVYRLDSIKNTLSLFHNNHRIEIPLLQDESH